jgi:hypothetical protein
MNAYIVFYQDANSWNSFRKPPKAVFLDKLKAEEYASKQPGYGLNKDWFVEEIPLNPED